MLKYVVLLFLKKVCPKIRNNGTRGRFIIIIIYNLITIMI